MPDTSIAERVLRGVAWLDQHDPGWWREDAPEYRDRNAQPIDLDRLDLGDPCGCIFGHRWGYYGHAPVGDTAAASLGCYSASALAADPATRAGVVAEYAELTAEWRRVIRERREAVTVDA